MAYKTKTDIEVRRFAEEDAKKYFDAPCEARVHYRVGYYDGFRKAEPKETLTKRKHPEGSSFVTNEYVSEKVIFYREKLGIGKKELAEKIGIDKRHLFNIENGKGDITIGLLYRLADGLKVNINKLIPKMDWYNENKK